MNHIDVMKQALEALDCIYSPLHVREIEKVGKAMSALRAAIEQTPGNPAEDGVCEALECCKQQLEDARTEAVAFPVLIDRRHDPEFDYETGMTLRDYFAAKAVQGMLACEMLRATEQEFADRAYKVADAMLKARAAE